MIIRKPIVLAPVRVIKSALPKKKKTKSAKPPKRTAVKHAARKTQTAMRAEPKTATIYSPKTFGPPKVAPKMTSTGSSNTRQMNAEESLLWKKYLKELLKERKTINSVLNRGRILRKMQNTLDVMGYLDPVVWRKTDTARMEAFARLANGFERITSKLESGAYFLQKRGNDFDVMSMSKPIYEGVSEWPLILARAAFVVVAGLIAHIVALITDAKKKDTEYGEKLLAADQWAASQPEKIRKAYAGMRKDPANAPFWPQVAGAAKTVLIAGLGVLGLYALYRSMNHAHE